MEPSYFWPLISFCTDLGIIFGPLIGYVAQIMEIRNKKSAEGFSSRVSAILIVANLTRMFFWYSYV